MPVMAFNRRAKFDYEILDTYEAGLVLRGYEVKSIKSGRVSLKGSFVTMRQNLPRLPELFLTNAHIAKYEKASTVDNYDPERPRKLLLNKSEIRRLIGKKQVEGLTLIPLKIYTKHSFIKLEFALARGKKKRDKREAIKKRDVDRQLRTLTKESYR
jgi:SsrA-binding protein